MSATTQKTPPSAYDSSDGLRQFADVRGVYAVAASNWRLMAWFCLVIAILCSAVTLVAIRSPREVPYVVAMNDQNQPTALGTASMLTTDQRAEVIITQYVLRQFVQNWRMVVPAADFQNKMIADYVTPFLQPGSQAAATMAAFYQAANPYERAKRYTVDVSVDQPLPQTGTTYEVHWTETDRDFSAHPIQTSAWRALVTVAYKTPDAASIRLNPAGIAITSLTVAPVSATNASPQP